MQWEKVSSASEQEIYELRNKEKKLLKVDFHPATNSARIEYADERRVFLIRKEGFLRNKTVLCTEYGFRLGQLVRENKESFIELNHERFYYTIRNNPLAELVIYKEFKDQPLVVCGLNVNKSNSFVQIIKDKILSTNILSALVLALCWYIFLPVDRENRLEYAV
jgi:hypothetical protein